MLEIPCWILKDLCMEIVVLRNTKATTIKDEISTNSLCLNMLYSANSISNTVLMVLIGCRQMGKLCVKKQNQGEERKLNYHLAEKLFKYLFLFPSKMKTRIVETSQ